MSNSIMSNLIKQQSSPCPTNGHRQAVGDGAFSTDIAPSVLAVCHVQGTDDDLYYYSTTFSGGPGVSFFYVSSQVYVLIVSHSGGFDITKEKCPPDRGSSDWVTDSLVPMIPSFSQSLPSTQTNITNHTTAAVFPSAATPRKIPGKPQSYDLPTPPLTPDDGDDDDDALDLLLNIFPHNGVSLLPFAKSIVVSAPNMGAFFDGVVLEFPGKSKTLYVDGKNAPAVSLRESVVALLDLADEQLQCSALVIVLDKSSSGISELLHSLMYVGGSVVTKPPFQVNPAYVLMGLEIQ
ncbi:ornithine decarboxylase antizyme-domain-containing protein [Pisolithus orientalis]|uniref:ornithine decarboxylase antizyme-domain-containing protein n=1 Tax=Pisolithus orientalis TaxID=936130 RepID=UPI0022247B9C|nr:ornithine decarboxylase antizyme-domain-containing protein [Pisolithus orientalis]KAI6033187.1 ornithine decarboxylase antizyme-domain-containing protein [Pisolithus orientalis]